MLRHCCAAASARAIDASLMLMPYAVTAYMLPY